jgi:hypothetical protein
MATERGPPTRFMRNELNDQYVFSSGSLRCEGLRCGLTCGRSCQRVGCRGP